MTPDVRALASLEDVEALSGNALADTTRTDYAIHWSIFTRWCAAVDKTACPAEPETVALHLLARSAHVAHSTICSARSSIRWFHLQAGHSNPCDELIVDRTVKSLGYRLGRGVRTKVAPLTREQIGAALGAHDDIVDSGETIWMRQWALLLTAWSNQLNCADLARVRSHIVADADGNLLLPVIDADGVESPERVVVYRRDDDLCPVTAITSWLAAGVAESQYLFAMKGDRSAATMRGRMLYEVEPAKLRTALHNELKDVAAPGRVDFPMAPHPCARLTDHEMREVLERAAPPPDLKLLRATAFVLLGYASSSREISLSALDWEDVLIEPARICLTMQTKSRPEPHTVMVPRDEDPRFDAGAALQRWQTATGLSDGPVFVLLAGTARPVPRRGTRFTNQAANQDIDLFCELGGLPPIYSTRSLRTGYVTDHSQANTPLAAIQVLTEQTTGRITVMYDRTNSPADLPAHQAVHEQFGSLD